MQICSKIQEFTQNWKKILKNSFFQEIHFPLVSGKSADNLSSYEDLSCKYLVFTNRWFQEVKYQQSWLDCPLTPKTPCHSIKVGGKVRPVTRPDRCRLKSWHCSAHWRWAHPCPGWRGLWGWCRTSLGGPWHRVGPPWEPGGSRCPPASQFSVQHCWRRPRPRLLQGCQNLMLMSRSGH